MLCGGKDTTFFAELALCSLLWGETRGLFAKKRGVFSAKTPSFWGKVQGDDSVLLRAGGKVGFIGGNSAAQ